MQQIIKFYVDSKKIEQKKPTGKDIEKWVAEIRAQDSTNHIKGGKVK